MNDYDQAIAFFTETLDFTLTADVDQTRKRWVTVQPPAGGTGLVLALPTTEPQRAALGRQTGDRVGLFLMTEEFDRTYRRLTAAGITFEEAPRVEPYGTVAVWRDPWSNRWDLLQPAAAPA